MEEKILKELYKLMQKASNKDEVPVAALIVNNNKIISKAYNLKNKKNSVLEHAEIIVIKKASKKLRNWRLNTCELYVTLEPCLMCKSIIEESRIKKVFFISPRKINYKSLINYQKMEINSSKYEEKLKEFFIKKRSVKLKK